MNELYHLDCMPLYWNNAEYAEAHGEIEQWKESYLISQDLKLKIDSPTSGIESQHDENELRACLGYLMQLYGLERLIYLTAVTIQQNPDDGRYDRTVREWSEQFDFSAINGQYCGVRDHVLAVEPTALSRAVPILREAQDRLDALDHIMQGRSLYQVLAEMEQAADAADPEEDDFAR